MGRGVHNMRALVAGLLVLQFSAQCSSQPLPVLPLNRFGTKNTYNNTFCEQRESASPNVEETEFCCPPVQVVMLSRHGIRYPGKKDIVNGHAMISEMKRRGVSPLIIKHLQSVMDSFPISEASLLAESGAKEQWDLGRRTGQRFASMIRKNDHLTFVSSTSQRTVLSEKNFEQGFDKGLGWNASSTYQQRDDLLRFFDVCPRYISEVKKNKSAFAEYHKFRDQMFPHIVQRIASRLLVDSLNISDDELFSLHKLAAVEYAVLGTRNWVNLLDTNDLNVLEFSSDLKQYYKVGYGYPINYKISCPLISDMFHHIDDMVSGYRSSRGVFYFGHAESLVPVLAVLGLFHDRQPLRADTFDDPSLAEARKFRTSAFVPFSANVAFVLHDCAAGPGPTTTRNRRPNVLNGGGDSFLGNVSAAERYFVQLLLNERPVKFPLLCGRSICAYSELRDYYSSYIDYCHFQQECEIPMEA